MTQMSPQLQQHPLSAAFPAMPEQELEALAMDIEEHGQREPGVLFEEMVLDGWHRYLGCQKAGVEFRAVEFDGADPVAFVRSKNLHRRHLTASQRAAAVVTTASWRTDGRLPRNAAAAATLNTAAAAHLEETPLSNKEMARVAEVSERTIRHAKAAHTAGVGEEVKNGAISAEQGAEVAKLPRAKRAKAVKAIKEGTAPKKEKTPDDAKARAELIDLQGKYADLLEKNAELSDVANELNDKLEAFETTEPDEQQKLIADLQLKLRRKDAEIDRLRVQIRDANNKNNDLIREVKKLQRRAGVGQ